MIMKTERFAEWLHNSYELISEDQNWNTQKSCQVDFKDLPSRNKAVMIRMAERIKIKFHMFFDKIIEDRLKDMITSNILEDELLKLKQKVRESLRSKEDTSSAGSEPK